MPTDVTREQFEELVLAADGPHVDLGPLLGLAHPLRVGVEGLHGLLAGQQPAFSVDWGAGKVTVQPQDGGAAVALEVKW